MSLHKQTESIVYQVGFRYKLTDNFLPVSINKHLQIAHAVYEMNYLKKLKTKAEFCILKRIITLEIVPQL